MQRPPADGLTVIELMVAVAVAAVVVSLAVPSMREFAVRQRVKAINAELVNDLQFARSESVARGLDVSIAFRTDNDSMTCYTIQTSGTGQCDCRRPLGAACELVPGVQELKTVQVPRATTVTLTPANVPTDNLRFFEPEGQTYQNDFHVTVASSTGGQLRTEANAFGRPQVCSPDGSVTGVATC